MGLCTKHQLVTSLTEALPKTIKRPYDLENKEQELDHFQAVL